MKRLIGLLLAVSSVAAMAAPTAQMVFIDSGDIMKKSKMGAAFEREVNDIRNEAQTLAMSEQSKIGEMEKNISEKYKGSKVVDQMLVAAEIAEIEKAKRHAGFSIEEKKREVTAAIEAKEREISQKIMVEVKNVAEKQGWGAVSDLRASGCVFVAEGLNKTDDVVKAINLKHDAEVARAALGKTKTA
ncbi:OmpH family outer membrane protein [Candidatus Babeliales bacterium]|nr:OmpH family outer membrane protein [Candidatus Babeliales bacterium]